MHEYSTDFHDQALASAFASARAIVPIVMRLLDLKRTVDVGCGFGAWLAVFREHGVSEVLGVDGPYVDRKRLLIPQDRFIACDLTLEIEIEGCFDLVVSLEVAEHLPAEAAASFVGSLTKLGPAVLFSAAVPGQGGVHHVNEQWPDYWAAMFRDHGFVAIDCIREFVWQSESVAPWYAQNCFLYIREKLLAESPRLQVAQRLSVNRLAPVIHPRLFSEKVWQAKALALLEDLLELVPAGCTIALIDDNYLSKRCLKPWNVHRVQERDGVYWGPPESAEQAIFGIETASRLGARFVAVAWPAFWWLKEYAGLGRHLGSTARCVVENDRLILFTIGNDTTVRPP